MLYNAPIPSAVLSRSGPSSAGIAGTPPPVTRTTRSRPDMRALLGAKHRPVDRLCAGFGASRPHQAPTTMALTPPSGANAVRCRALSCDVLYCDRDTGRPYRTQSLPYVNLDEVERNERKIGPGKYLEKDAFLRSELANNMQIEVEYNLVRSYQLRVQEADVMRVAVTKDGTTFRHTVSALGRGTLDDKVEVQGELTDPENPDRGPVTLVVTCGVHEQAAT